MADINTVVLVGRLVRDGEMRVSAGGLAILKFALAINSRKKQGDAWVDEANFFDCVLMGRQAEAIQQYMTKGKQIGVSGELRQNRWQNEAKENRSKIEILVKDLQLLSGKDGGGQRAEANRHADAGFGSGFDDDFPI